MKTTTQLLLAFFWGIYLLQNGFADYLTTEVRMFMMAVDCILLAIVANQIFKDYLEK